ncbi:MAG: TIGR03085 family metal-binding protein [Ornithinibacter sp.]
MTSDQHVSVVQGEREALCDTFLELGPDAPTLCSPWLTRDLAAHLVVRENRPDLASGMWFAPLEGRLERGQAALAAGDYLALVDTVRSGPPWWSPTRVGRVDALVNTAELVVHHEDALRGDGAVGPRREVPERTSRAVVAVLRRSASLMFRRADVGVRLVAPGAEPVTTKGTPVVTVTGEPVELLLVAFGRMQVADVAFEGAPGDVEALKQARLGV